MNNRWIVKHDGEIVYQPQTIDGKILDISDEALAKILMYVNGESITISNLKLEIEDLKAQLNKAEKVIEYYANPESWDFEEILDDLEFCEDPQANLGGKRARDFILKLEGKCKIIE